MGQSTDAYLFYGIFAEEEMSYLDVAFKLGLVKEKENIDEGGFYSDDLDAVLPLGFKSSGHCSCEYFMPFIYMKKTMKIAYRGYPKRFQNLPQTNPVLIRDLAIMAEKLGWQNPSWNIASMWC